jgi:chemotaxis protein CheX
MEAPKLTVLIVEDEEPIRVEIRNQILKHFPFAKTYEATNGSEGLLKMRQQKFDLVITDLSLPKKDGRTLIKDAQGIGPNFRPGRFMIISEDAFEAEFPTHSGGVEFFAKPIKWEPFLIAIAKTAQVPPPESLKPAAEKAAPLVDVNFINAFVSSALNVIITVSGIEAEKKRIFLKKLDEPVIGDISAIISMNSDAYLGSMAITFTAKCYLEIVNAMIGESYTVIDEDNKKAVGEFCGQIFSGAKRKLNDQGHDIQQALPCVVTGKDHKIQHTATGNVFVIEFSTIHGLFWIEAVLEKRT